jgi:putative ABC transport system permease protein
MILGAALLTVSGQGLASSIVATIEDETATALISVMGVFIAIVVLLSVGIIAGSFGFCVALRRKELALYRMIGASGKRLKNMLIGESVVLAVLGSLVGVIVGAGLTGLFLDIINDIEIVPNSLVDPNVWFVLPSAFVCSILIAVWGASIAGRRATKISPIEALQDANLDIKLVSKQRVIWGIVMVLSSITLFVLGDAIRFEGEEVAIYVSFVMFGGVFAVIALVCFAPLYLPILASWVSCVGSVVTSGRMASRSIRLSARRTSGLASFVMLSIALVAVMAIVMNGLSVSPDMSPEDIAQNIVILNALIVPIGIFAVLSIVNTLVMAFSVRQEEFVKMRLLGFGKGQIVTIAILESIFTILVGVVLGIAIALLTDLINQNILNGYYPGLGTLNTPWAILGTLSALYLGVSVVVSVVAVFITCRKATVLTVRD